MIRQQKRYRNFWWLCVCFFCTAAPLGCSASPKLPRIPADAVVLAFGDSITFGTGASPGESYPAVLAQLIGRKVVNGGVPGEVSAAGVERLKEVLDAEKPALVLLCHGGNDLLRRFDKNQTAENLRRMIIAARERGVAVVLIGVPSPDLSLKPPEFYRDLALEFDLPYDKASLSDILGKRKLKTDYIHPNSAGYRVLAEALAKLLADSGAL